MNISSITSKGVKHEVIDATARAKAEDNARKIAEGGGGTPTLQEKEATDNGVITPDEGYDGLSKVTVNVIKGPGAVKLYAYIVAGSTEARSVMYFDRELEHVPTGVGYNRNAMGINYDGDPGFVLHEQVYIDPDDEAVPPLEEGQIRLDHDLYVRAPQYDFQISDIVSN